MSPEVSDDAFQLAKNEQIKNPNQLPLVKHCMSNEVEHMVYKAIERLIQDQIAEQLTLKSVLGEQAPVTDHAPFIAVRGMNIDVIKHLLPRLFPNLSWEESREDLNECFRQYDFILIGPKTGIIMIEATGSSSHHNYPAPLTFCFACWRNALALRCLTK